MEAIELKNIRKNYMSKTVLDNVDFSFTQGSFYVLSGESGCGKTTLLNIIAGYAKADSGEVLTNSKIEYFFQDDMLFSGLTVEENLKIRLFAKNSNYDNLDADIINALKKFKTDHLINQKTAFISGGERHRVELAGIMLSNPDVILLDEPTAKLDKDNKTNILSAITETFEGKTLIAVTHEPDIFSDKFIRLKLKGGKLEYE